MGWFGFHFDLDFISRRNAPNPKTRTLRKYATTGYARASLTLYMCFVCVLDSSIILIRTLRRVEAKCKIRNPYGDITIQTPSAIQNPRGHYRLLRLPIHQTRGSRSTVEPHPIVKLHREKENDTTTMQATSCCGPEPRCGYKRAPGHLSSYSLTTQPDPNNQQSSHWTLGFEREVQLSATRRALASR